MWIRVRKGTRWPSALRTSSRPISSTRMRIPGIGLDVHLPVSIEQRNVVDVQAPEVRLEREIHVIERHLLGLELVAVDLHEELGLVHREAAEQSDQTRVRVALVRQVPHGPLQGAEAGPAAVLNLELEPAGGAQAIDRRRAEHRDPGSADVAVLLAQFGGDGRGTPLRVSLSLFKGLQNDEHASHVADVGAQQRGVARKVDRMPDPRDLLRIAGDRAHLLDDLVGTVQAGAVGQLGIDNQISLVLIRDKSDRNGLEPEVGQPHEAAVDQQGDDGDSQKDSHGPTVGVDRAVEHPIECREEGAQRRFTSPARNHPAAAPAAAANQPNAPQRRRACVTGGSASSPCAPGSCTPRGERGAE